MARPSLFTHRKFAHLEYLLGSRIVAVGVLELIWQRAYADGDPVLGRPEIVEHSIGWDGEVGFCISALVESGFVDLTDDGQVTVHDLDDHAPSYVKKRKSREAERKHRPVSDQSMTGQRQTVTRTPAPAPAPAPAPKSTCLPDHFDEFWDEYPRKTSKKAAERAWRKLTETQRVDAAAALPSHVAYWKNTKRPIDKIPHPATWINGENWNDELPSLTPPSQHVGATSNDSEWVYDSYRRADMEAHSDHPRWPEYVIASAEYPLRTAPTFETWLEVAHG